MKVKLGQIVNSKDSIQELLNTKLPIKISYSLNKLALLLNPELEIYEKKRKELVEEFGTKQADGETKVENENLPKFAEELNKVFDLDIEVEFIKLKIEDLGDIKIEPSKLPLWIFE